MEEIAESLAEKIQAVLEEWVTEQGGGMIGDFALVANYYDDQGEAAWAAAYPPRQPPSATLGLLRWQTLSVEEQARRYFAEDVGDDEFGD